MFFMEFLLLMIAWHDNLSPEMSYDFFFPFCVYCTCHRYQYEHQIDGLGLQNINKPPRLKILIIWVEPAINGAESVFFVSHTQMCIKDMNKFVHDSLLKYTDGKKKEWIKQDIKWTVGCLKVWFWESSGNVQGCGGSWVGSCHLPISLQAKFYTCQFSEHKSRYAGIGKDLPHVFATWLSIYFGSFASTLERLRALSQLGPLC